MRNLILTVALGMAPVAAAAGQPAPTPTSTPAPVPPCSAPEHRQFDFWLGDWRVTDAAGELAGHNTVDRILGGCVVRERWQGAAGSHGTSYNIYDAARGRWHQTWVDDRGLLLQLDGGLEDGDMVLRGHRPRRDGGGTALHEVRWTPLADGRVRQRWQVSTDGGASWREVFDGYYSRGSTVAARDE